MLGAKGNGAKNIEYSLPLPNAQNRNVHVQPLSGKYLRAQQPRRGRGD